MRRFLQQPAVLMTCCLAIVQPATVAGTGAPRSSNPAAVWKVRAQASGSPALSVWVSRVRNSCADSGRDIPSGGITPRSHVPDRSGRRALSAGRRAPKCLYTYSELGTLIRSRVGGGLGPDGSVIGAAEREQLQALYGPGDYRPLWLDAVNRPGPLAREALALLRRAPSEGLDAEDYEAERLLDLVASLASAAATPALAASFDVALSDRTLTYLRHLHSGRINPETVGFRMRYPVDHHDFAAMLRDAIQSGSLADTVATLTPSLSLYGDLRDALARYRSLAAETELDPLPVPRSSIRVGDPYPAIRSLHYQLAVLRDLPEQAPPPADAIYEKTLEQGVRRFQMRHGLEPDGIIGRRTFAALGVPLSWRVRQIELALERLRWVPHLSAGRGILVNIPMFRLWTWESLSDGRAPSFTTDVIVGRALGPAQK